MARNRSLLDPMDAFAPQPEPAGLLEFDPYANAMPQWGDAPGPMQALPIAPNLPDLPLGPLSDETQLLPNSGLAPLLATWRTPDFFAPPVAGADRALSVQLLPYIPERDYAEASLFRYLPALDARVAMPAMYAATADYSDPPRGVLEDPFGAGLNVGLGSIGEYDQTTDGSSTKPHRGEGVLAQVGPGTIFPTDNGFPSDHLWVGSIGEERHDTGPQAIPEDAMRAWNRFGLYAYLGRLFGLDNATAHLEHYRGATGDPMPMTREMVRSIAPFRNGEKSIEYRYEQSFIESPSDVYANPESAPFVESRRRFGDQLRALKDGESTIINDDWAVLYNNWIKKYLGGGGYDLDADFTWGNTSLKSIGTFTATRRGNTINIEGTATHSLDDPYDFGPGPMYGNDAELLEQYGLAKKYNRSASWKRRFTGTIELKNGQLQNPKFKWEDIN